ncbi:MAG: hypothetical protein ACYTEL_22545 [Planctomycetota bacterium]|jgi:hypothetical protein
MEYDPPEGSGIKIVQTRCETIYSWREQERRRTKWRIRLSAIVMLGFSAGFLIFGLYHPGTESGKWSTGLLVLLLVFTGLGIVGGLFFLVGSLRPARPFQLILSPGYVEYRPGVRNVDSFAKDHAEALDYLADLMKKAKKLGSKIEVGDITNLKLETIDGRKRLSFDYAADRFEIGETLSDAERQWLYEVMREHLSR